MQIIKKAWIESDGVVSKLCVRYSPDTGAENFGNFFPKHRIVPEEFEGLSSRDACRKFRRIVYSDAPTLEQTISKLIEYADWWKDKPQPYRDDALGQLNHTKRRLQAILKANANNE